MIDLVISYVDSNNDDWKRNYEQQDEESYIMYFRSHPEMLRYVLRSVATNIPFIRKVFLLVQNKSEVPSFIDTSKVEVVTHDQFIPEQYLPTFNSNTIESFLYNIESLSEQFLYMNDDLLILNPLNESNFYHEDKALTYWYSYKISNGGTHADVLIRNNKLIYNISEESAYKTGQTLSVTHTVRPYFKSMYRDCYLKYQDVIQPTLTKFRSKNNYSLYIVDAYQNLLGRSLNTSTVTLECIQNDISNRALKKAINSSKHTLCICDMIEDVDIFTDTKLFEYLAMKFNKISKYEKEMR